MGSGWHPYKDSLEEIDQFPYVGRTLLGGVGVVSAPDVGLAIDEEGVNPTVIPSNPNHDERFVIIILNDGIENLPELVEGEFGFVDNGTVNIALRGVEVGIDVTPTTPIHGPFLLDDGIVLFLEIRGGIDVLDHRLVFLIVIDGGLNVEEIGIPNQILKDLVTEVVAVGLTHHDGIIESASTLPKPVDDFHVGCFTSRL